MQMAENVENLLLEHLRAIRGDVADIKVDVRELKNRVTTLEAGLATLMQQIGHMAGSLAQQQASFDRMVERVERIERRLDLETT
jgi:uncharacterized coiled-coil protein SlyX